MKMNPFFHLNDDFFVHHISIEIYTYDGHHKYNKAINPYIEHSHQFASIIFIDSLTGSCDYIIDNHTYQIKAGDLILINPNIKHQICINKDSYVQEIHLCAQNYKFSTLPVDFLLDKCTHAVFNLLPFHSNLFRATTSALFISSFDKNNAFYQTFIQGIFLQVVALIEYIKIEYFTEDSTITYNNNSSINALASSSITQILYYYIQTHFMIKISISEFASNHYISKEHLCRSFKKEYGLSPLAYQTELRMCEATNLLSTTDMPLQKISETIGYTDYSHFNKLFKKYTGTTPSSFRDKQCF